MIFNVLNNLIGRRSRRKYFRDSTRLEGRNILSWNNSPCNYQDVMNSFLGKQLHHSCAYHVPVSDTTGAGDIFHAGFIYGLLKDWPLDRQLDFACAAAALNCTAVGARGGIKDVAEIEDLLVKGTHYPSEFYAPAPNAISR